MMTEEEIIVVRYAFFVLCKSLLGKQAPCYYNTVWHQLQTAQEETQTANSTSTRDASDQRR